MANNRKPTPELLKSERDSLQKIHTFSLKEEESDTGFDDLNRSRGFSQDSSLSSTKSFSQYLPEKV
jgi:hypothetical protein